MREPESFASKLGKAVVLTLVLGVIAFAGFEFRGVVVKSDATHDAVITNTALLGSMKRDMDSVPTLRTKLDVLDNNFTTLRTDVDNLKARQEKDDIFRETHSGTVPKRWTRGH